ncbi:MAG: hypothetical protein K2W95_02280 [Candidatus Obscuribacterales bacterium]|nr:hypothetical protein [Candidatus Obscuribacterales bacterium]
MNDHDRAHPIPQARQGSEERERTGCSPGGTVAPAEYPAELGAGAGADESKNHPAPMPATIINSAKMAP